VLGAQAPAWAQAAHRPAGSTVGVAGDEETGETEEAGTDETAGEDENAEDDQDTATDEDTGTGDATDTESADSADNCTTDPTGLTPEDLAAMNHGAIVCWAAQQTTWPEEFANHGAFVSSWAHAANDAAKASRAAGHSADAATKGGHAKGKGKGHQSN
jgi:hypothetical protein